MPKDKSNAPKAEQHSASQLSDEQLAEASAGATEELKGAYNFLLEVAGVTPDAQRSQALAQPKSRDE